MHELDFGEALDVIAELSGRLVSVAVFGTGAGAAPIAVLRGIVGEIAITGEPVDVEKAHGIVKDEVARDVGYGAELDEAAEAAAARHARDFTFEQRGVAFIPLSEEEARPPHGRDGFYINSADFERGSRMLGGVNVVLRGERLQVIPE